MEVNNLLHRVLGLEFLTVDEGLHLWEHATTAQLMYVGNALRQHHVPNNTVTWIIDRNSNTTNVCIANCKFCNFFRKPGHEESYITTIEEYKKKIDETFAYGGNQLLLQGGHHPDLGLDYYCKLFRELKSPEVLSALKEAGLDSLPGAGAEILSDRVRRLISKGKCGGQEWLDVMRAAHQLHITTSATMMFGHVETDRERFEHFVGLREMLKRLKRARNTVTSDEYIRMIAMSRIMLPNVVNIQASWLTVGKQVAQVCLHSGANDFGSIMIEC